VDAAMAAVPSAREGVVGIAITPSIPADRMDEFMQGGIGGFARDNRLSHITKTTYHGRPAITAVGTTSDNQPVQVLFYAYSSTHMYVLLAPDQAALRTLEAHFHPTR
jgi:hypothetical protein